jgi:hypothetical protein
MAKYRVERNLHFLLLLVETSNYKQKKQLIITATPKQLLAICEVVKNVLYGRIKLNSSYKTQLTTHAKVFKFLSDKKLKLEEKRVIILKNLVVVLKFISPISQLKL